MSLADLWFVVVAVFWTGFFVLEGFDFGVGSAALGASAARRPSDAWPSTRSGRSGTATRCGWSSVAPPSSPPSPPGTPPGSPRCYLAVVLLLVALIVRGLSFELRGKGRGDRWRWSWSLCLTVGSVLAPTLLGIALGDLLAGLPVDQNEEFTGTFWDLFTGFGVWTGLTLLLLCLLHGATFLALRTAGDLTAAGAEARPGPGSRGPGVRGRLRRVDGRDRRPRRGVLPCCSRSPSWGSAPPLWASAGTRTAVPSPPAPSPWLPPSGPCSRACTRRSWSPAPSAANSLTVAGSASGDYALKVMTVVAAVFFPLVLLYQGYTYRVFRHRIQDPTQSAGSAG